MNYYTEVVASDTITASQEDADKLIELMETHLLDEDGVSHGMEAEYYGGHLHMFDNDGCGNLESFHGDILEHIGNIVTKAGLEFWEFGISYSAGRKAPGSRGGCYARITKDGGLVFSETIWPKDT